MLAKFNGRRLAAYRLSSVSSKDRNWVLKQLEPEQRNELKTFIKEITSRKFSGIDFDALLASDSLPLNDDSAIPNNKDTVGIDQKDIEKASIEINTLLKELTPTELNDILDNLSPSYVALIGRSYSEFFNQYVTSCKVPRARKVRLAVDSLPVQLPLRVLLSVDKFLIELLRSRREAQ